MYFRNPSGRIVAIDDQESIERYKMLGGFTRLEPEEEKEYIATKMAMVENEKRVAPPVDDQGFGEGLYFVTVTQNQRADGYGVASSCIMQELSRLGVDVKTTFKNQKVGVLFHSPHSVMQFQTGFRVIYTMFESDKIPDEWHPYLESADLILVPSKWCQATFKAAGFETTVLPLGYNDIVFEYTPRDNKRNTRQTFNFLHYNAFNIRKGFPEVFKAFTEEFDRTEPVRLILKTVQTEYEIPTFLRNIGDQYPNIEVISGRLPGDEMQKLMERSDCFVFPSRGEGFGMTPLEAMATGMPAIVPNAHGITEYFNGDYMYEVKVDHYCPALYSRYKNMDVGKMVVCSVEDLRRQMRYVYEHQAEALEKGKRASEYVKRWTLRKTAAQLKDIVLGLQSKQAPDRKLRDILMLERIA